MQMATAPKNIKTNAAAESFFFLRLATAFVWGRSESATWMLIPGEGLAAVAHVATGTVGAAISSGVGIGCAEGGAI
jgi:hypothetical protein